MDAEELEALKAVIEYLWADEHHDWVAEGEPEDHLFCDLMTLDAYVKGHGHD